MIEENDDLSEILGPKSGSPAAELREKLLRLTETRLVHLRWLHRGFRIGTIATVFLVGGLIGWFVKPTPLPISPPAQEPGVVFVPVAVPVPISIEHESSGPQAINQRLSGSETELLAEQADDPNAAAMLYKQAGDSFLHDQDYANATRCYRVFLVRAGDNALSLNPDDSWLLTSLKNTAFQEKSHVQKTDS